MSTFEVRVREWAILRERRRELVGYTLCLPAGIALFFVVRWLPPVARWPVVIAGIFLLMIGTVKFLAINEDAEERVQAAIETEDRQAETDQTVLSLSIIALNPGRSAGALVELGVDAPDLSRLANTGLVAYQDGGWHLTGSGDILLGQTCAGDLLEADKGDRAW